jgi:putative metalloenzyme radical SAM/SPASM domain maturase
MVALARRDMPASSWIGFQTNGQLLTAARARSLVQAGVNRICVSADAVAPDVFSKLREGGKQSAVESALKHVHAAARAVGNPVSLGIEFVAMRDNVDQLPELVRWAARHHVDFVLVTHMLPYAKEMAQAAAFETSADGARAIYREWKTRAAAEGVDIGDLGRYYNVFMRLHRTPEENRVVEWVTRMIKDASDRGITLHLGRLSASDENLQQRVEASFAEATEAARELGIDLKLPASVPKLERRCDFIEDGSAFISWNGDVHPCYFLWHKYSCFVGGSEKKVAPQVFGNIRQQDIMEIWNGVQFGDFRNEVVRYEYPFCHDCNAALCGDVRDEVVEDCHLGSVPCAACMWCTGVFQCLQ